MKKAYRLIVVMMLLSSFSYSQPFENTLVYDSLVGSPKASINDLSWIAGYWKGEAMGGVIEEIWSTPLAGAMMGSFKMTQGDQVIFYELETLTEEDGTVILRLKHFNSDLTGWEKKEETVDFKLVQFTKTNAYFDGLTFELVNQNELDIYVVIEEENKAEEVKFHYERIK